jgi:4,5-dihydroxyphthalate decarboxylase
MSALTLRIATVPYDRVVPLRTGEVVPDGIALDYVTAIPAHEIFLRMAEKHEFDVSEMSLALYCTMRARGRFPFVAIPVFPSRVFRHGSIFVRRAAGIENPKDMEGRRIGIQEYRQTALVWARGMLRDEHGVDTGCFRWIEGGVNGPRRPSETDIRPSGGVSIEPLSGHESLSAALAAGGIDAAITARQPDSLRGSDAVARLFPDYRAAERDYFRRTGNFPIMHTIVIREELHEEAPWIARSLYEAFGKAKEIAWRQLRYTGALTVMAPWILDDVDEIDALFGGDAFPYGLERNRAQLETFLRYLVEDGLLDAAPVPEALFVPVT